jgi:hypothetical protein
MTRSIRASVAGHYPNDRRGTLSERLAGDAASSTSCDHAGLTLQVEHMIWVSRQRTRPVDIRSAPFPRRGRRQHPSRSGK